MSAIKKINDNEMRRDVVSSDRTTVYTDGYKNLFTSSTPVTIADIIAATGTITLSNVYIPGTDNLNVSIDGVDLLEPGIDFTEDDNQTITLAPFHVSTLNPVTSKIKIIWNRPLPGARDQELANLKDVDPDLSDAIKDTGALRTSAVDAANPLGALQDIYAVNRSYPVHRHLVAVGATAIGTPTKATLDLAALSTVPVPPGATHAMVRASLRVAASDGVAASVDFYISNSAVDPFGTAPEIAEANLNTILLGPDLPAGAAANRLEFVAVSALVPINVAVPNLHYWIGDSTGAYAGLGDYQADIWLEYYLAPGS